MMKRISSKIETGERLSDSDALWLYQHADLNELGALANRVNLQKNGLAVFYNINRHINPTNICALSCKFCAYSKKIGDEGGYAYEIDEMIGKAGEAIAQGATELHMVGGLHPRWPFQRYVDMIAALHKAYPQVHLKAFTAVELDWMARRSRKTIKDVMVELKNAGLGSFPGGGAEIFHPEIRDQICDTKVSGEQWIDTHRTAHNLGLRSNCTMLYGHIENYAHRVDHMRRLRELQDETGGFNVFIPLAFQPFQNEMGIHRYTFGADDLRTIAVARLYLDNFKNIKSYWVMLGQDIAQLALQFGANDLDGTVLEEKISRAAGGRAGMIMTRTNLEQLIRRSGRTPVERTTLYKPVKQDDTIHLEPVDIATSTSEEHRILKSLLSSQDNLTSDALYELATKISMQAIGTLVRDIKTNKPNALNIIRSVIITTTSEVTAQTELLTYLNTLDGAGTNPHDASEVAIILDCDNSINYDLLKSVISKINSLAPSHPLLIQGINWCKDLAKNRETTLYELLAALKSNGLGGVIESAADAELMHPQEKTALYRAAAELNMAVLPSLVLRDLNGAPDWGFWADQVLNLLAARDFAAPKSSICLRVRAGSVIMPTEYLKALALTRLVAANHYQIRTPLEGIFTLSPQQGLGVSADHHPATKLVSILANFGSDGLSYVFANKYNYSHVLQDWLGADHKISTNSLDKNGPDFGALSAVNGRFSPDHVAPTVGSSLSSL